MKSKIAALLVGKTIQSVERRDAFSEMTLVFSDGTSVHFDAGDAGGTDPNTLCVIFRRNPKADGLLEELRDEHA